MKNYLSILLLSVILFLMVPIASVFGYTGGLLNGQLIKYYNDDTFFYDMTELTDGGFSNYSRANITPSQYLEYTFDRAKKISDYQIFSYGEITIEFYDSSNKLISFVIPKVVDGTKTPLTKSISNVVRIKIVPNEEISLYEFDVFGTEEASVSSVPTNLSATASNAQVTLTWKAVPGATSYNIKRSTTASGPYTTVASNVYDTSSTDRTVTNGTTYYYVVTAINASGESNNSNEASATLTAPVAPTVVTPPVVTPVVTPPTTNAGNRALLVITLVSGLEKEYELSMTDVNSFTAWYAARAGGTGPEVYTINKTFNKANFLSRKDNIAFDKIELYEINEYTPAP